MMHAPKAALAFLAAAALVGCSNPSPPSAPAPPSPPAVAANDGPKTFLGRQVDSAIDQARKELRAGNISISDGFNIQVNGRDIHQSQTLPKAEISPKGDLLIEGKAVPVDAAQRAQLLAYRGEVIGLAESGMALGVHSADLAGEALTGVASAIFGGEKSEQAFEQRIEAEATKIEAQAVKLCSHLPVMRQQQQALAASLPAFKPYAGLTQEDVDDCGSKVRDSGVVAGAN